MTAAAPLVLFLFALVLAFAFTLYLLSILRVLRADRSILGGSGDPAASGPAVSVVVAARDEEENLPALFESLAAQEDLAFELVVVIDRSRDRSARVARDFAGRASFPVRVLENSRDQLPGHSPKTAPLSAGIEAASGDLLLFTDADCRVPPGWVGAYRRAFRSDPSLGLAIGPVLVSRRKGWLGGYQHLDHCYRYSYAAALMLLGFPVGGFGNNLAIRTACYRDLGGFEGLPASFTEDAVLITAAGRHPGWKVRGLVDPSVRIVTEPQGSFRAHLRQLTRWTIGALRSPSRGTRWAYTVCMGALTFCVASAAALPFIPGLLPYFALGIGYLYSTGAVSGILLYRDSRYWRWMAPGMPLFLLYYQATFLAALVEKNPEW